MAKGTCVIDGCDRPVKIKKRGWCALHYSRWTRHGDPLICLPLGRPAQPGAVANRYPSRTLTCQYCGDSFRGRHGKRCRRCKYSAEQRVCECGKRIHPEAKQCSSCRGRGVAGPANPRWKGGRFLRNGYVYTWQPGHPRYGGNYVPEHVAVMEATIGRFLLPGENVHHRNGVKHDNRPENLELWAKGQPAGQRAVDLLAWAREIIARYEPLEGTLGPIPGECAPAPVP